jgi:DNA-binding MarR family transcriptional regulator
MKSEKPSYCGCLYYASNALARMMTKIAEEEFAVTGLSPSYAIILMTVINQPGLQAGEIAGVMQLTPSTITRLLEKMEGKGLLVRQSEGRATEVYPTGKGIDLKEIISKAWGGLYQRYSNILGEKEGQMLASHIAAATSQLQQA